MPQVSRRPIKAELSTRMNEVLWESLSNLRSKQDISAFLLDILTPTERIMLAKRLAIALLLSRGWDQEAIDSYLKVSLGTIQTVKKNLVSGVNGYQKVISLIEKGSEWEQMKLDLSQAFEEILAGRVGANWKQTKPAVAKKYQEKRAKYKVL